MPLLSSQVTAILTTRAGLSLFFGDCATLLVISSQRSLIVMLTNADRTTCRCGCYFKIPSASSIPIVCSCLPVRSVIVVAGQYQGQVGVVVNRVGEKTLIVRLNPKQVKVRESSVQYLDEEDGEEFCKTKNETVEPPSKLVFNASRDRSTFHGGDAAEASTSPSRSPSPSPSPSPVLPPPPPKSSSERLSIGASVKITGGSYPGKKGIVTILHRVMVTIRLSSGKDVRIMQCHAQVDVP